MMIPNSIVNHSPNTLEQQWIDRLVTNDHLGVDKVFGVSNKAGVLARVGHIVVEMVDDSCLLLIKLYTTLTSQVTQRLAWTNNKRMFIPGISCS